MKKFLVILLVLALSLSMVACKDDDQDAKGPAPTDEVQGSLVVGNENFGGDFISGWGSFSVDNNIQHLVNAPYLVVQTPEGKYVTAPYVDKREISDDGLVHTFTFTDDYVNGEHKWSDGVAMTVDDIMFCFDFYMDSEALQAAGGSTSLDTYLESYEKVGDNQIKFTLKENIYATDFLTFWTMGPMYKDYYMKDKPADKSVQQHVRDNLISKPVGAGPYKLVEYVEGSHVKLTVNDTYMGNWQGNKPKIKDLLVKVVVDETELDELLVGQVELLAGVIQADRIDAVKEDDGHTYNNYPRHGYGLLGFHNDFGVAKYTEVRQAIAFAIDRATFREAFIGPYGISTDGPYSTNFWMIDEAWVEKELIHYEPNKDKVKELLEGAGWARGDDNIYAKDGEKLELNLACTSGWADTLNLVLDPEKTVEDYGIKIIVEAIDWAVLGSHLYGDDLSPSDRRYHMFALANGLYPVYDGYGSWHSTKIEAWGSGVSSNSYRFSSEETDKLLETIRYAKDDDTHQEAYREFIKIMNREMPLIPMYSNDYHDLYDNKLKNLETSPFWGWQWAIVDAHVE